MKPYLIALLGLIPMCVSAQVTPNLQLQLPVEGSTGWGTKLNANFTSLDSYLSGTISVPQITVTGAITNSNQLATKAYVDAHSGAFTLTTTGSSGAATLTNGVLNIPQYADVQSDWNASSGPAVILNKPALATVATSGSYTDLTSKPTIPVPVSAAQASPSSTTILQAANNGANQVIRVGVKGDSFTINYVHNGSGDGPLIATNRWAEQIRIKGQSNWGSHGTGVYPVITDVSGDANPGAWSCTGTTDTSNLSLGPFTGSVGSLVHMTNGATCTFSDSRSLVYTKLSVYYATPATSSSLAVVADGSTSMGTLTSANSTQAGAVNGGLTARRYDSATVLPATTHSIVYTCTGDCYLYANDGVNGTTGFSVDLEGISGATAATYGASTANQLAFDALIPGGEQALVYMDQTNDAAGSVPTSTFSTQVTNIVNYERALSSAPTVMLAIPPVDSENSSHPMAPYTAIQTGLCTSLSLTCVNIQSRGTTVGSTSVGWGTTYNASSGLWNLTGGGVHPNDAGNLDEFQQIYAQLFNPITGASSGSSSVTPIAYGSTALHTAAIASLACDTTTATATGLASTDAINWNPSASLKAVTGYAPSTSRTLEIRVYPTVNTFNADVCNNSASSITPGAVTLNWQVVRSPVVGSLTLISTTFNEASGGSTLLGTMPAVDVPSVAWASWTGNSWTYNSGGGAVSSLSQYAQVINPGQLATTATWTGLTNSSNTMYLAFRYTDASNWMGVQFLGSGGVSLVEAIAGTVNTLSTSAVALNATGSVVVTANGNSINVVPFGGTLLTYTIPSGHAALTGTGFGMYNGAAATQHIASMTITTP